MTWPPGDSRGDWSALFDLYGRLSERGDKLNLPDPVTLAHAVDLAKETPRILLPSDQEIVADTVRSLLQQGKLMSRIFAGAIERTHTHLLLAPTLRPIDDVIGRIKSQ